MIEQETLLDAIVHVDGEDGATDGLAFGFLRLCKRKDKTEGHFRVVEDEVCEI